MIELGHFACIIALCLAIAQAIAPKWQGDVLALQQSLLTRECLCLLLACVSLWWGFLNHDFSIAVVYAHSHHHLSWWYRLTALWGGHEGSVLLWITMLSGWRWAFTHYGDFDDQDKSAMMTVLAMIAVGLTAFLLFSSNPFLRILPNAPLEGNDLNPLLQDPGMASHPPILYFGYVAFALPYACACVMLWRGRVIEGWAGKLRPWILWAWSVLSVGIVLGSWWAYRELGWGGWWFWDPVENASLLPWFGGALLIHGLALAQKQQAAQTWTLLVAIIAFILSLLGTFLVRSGVLISVHSFAADPHRGVWILGLIGVYGAGALGLYSTRVSALFASRPVAMLSRAGGLMLNQGVLAVMLATVLLGTLYPIILEMFGLGKVSVGAPYFNQVMPLLCMPLLLGLLVLPGLDWQGKHWCMSWESFINLGILLVSMLVLTWLLIGWKPNHGLACLTLFIALMGMVVSIWHGCVQHHQLRKQHVVKSWAMTLAHVGFLGMIASIALTSVLSQSSMTALRKNKPYTLAGHTFVYQGSERIEGNNYHGVRAKIIVKNNGHSWVQFPERRIYLPSQMNLAHTAIIVRPSYDIYLALGEPLTEKDNQEGWTVRIQVKPWVRGIWCFALLMAVGGTLAAWSRRQGHAS